MTQSSRSKRASAMAWASRGFPVFPVRENSKLPAVPDWPNVATTDAAAVFAMWTHPLTGGELEYNIGTLCTNMIVCDVDVKEGKPGIETYEALGGVLDSTLTVLTPSGGYHLYFNGPDVCNCVAGVGLDIKARNGCVLAPGSVIDGVEYLVAKDFPILDVIPERLLARLRPSGGRAKRDAAVTELLAASGEGISAARAWLLEGAPEAVKGLNRNTRTYGVCCRLVNDYGVSEVDALALLLEDWNDRCSPPWSAEGLQTLVYNAAAYSTGDPGASLPSRLFKDVKAPPLLVSKQEGAQTRVLTATPWTKKLGKDMPKRPWIYGKHLLRKFVSMVIAGGAVGKSSLVLSTALALATGKSILGVPVHEGPHNVWLFNLEDPIEELELRAEAARKHFGISFEDVGDHLFVDSGRDQGLCVAKQVGNDVVIQVPLVEELIAEISRRKISVLIVDPFVSCHEVSENDNSAIDRVAKLWGYVAGRANCAILLVHHVRKLGGAEATADSSRGGGAVVNAARSVLVLNRMTEEEAGKAGVLIARSVFSVYDDKNNVAPPAEGKEWYHIVNVLVDNGEAVGVAAPWAWPNPADAVTPEELMSIQKAVGSQPCAASVQSRDWVGNRIAEVLDWDTGDTAALARIKLLIKVWVQRGVLVNTEGKNSSGRERPEISVGTWTAKT